MFADAPRYPFADQARVDGTATCLVVLLIGGMLLRLATRLWPDLTFLAPAFAAVVPLVVFLDLIGGVLAGDDFPPLAATETFRLAGRVVGVASVYLFPAAVTVVAVGYMTAAGSIPAVLIGVATAMLATVALLVTAACACLFPAATAVGVHEGLRAGLRQDAPRRAASGTYLFAWAGAAVLVVLAWGALVATISRSVAALPALGRCAYAHVAAVAFVAEGVGRTTPW